MFREVKIVKILTSDGFHNSDDSVPLSVCWGTMLTDVLTQQRDTICEKWVERIFAAYPPVTAKFLSNKKDQFSNPVGHTIRMETRVLFDALLDGVEPEVLKTSLDNIVKIRTVQDFTAAQAGSFVFLLKNVLREELVDQLGDRTAVDDLLAFESKIDGLALMAFDHYVHNKVSIYEIRAREAKRKSEMLIKQVNRIYDGQPLPDDKQES